MKIYGEPTKVTDKIVEIKESDAYHLHETIGKLSAVNSELLELLEVTLEANARLTTCLKDAYPHIAKRDRAVMVLDALLGIEEPLIREGAT